MDLKEHIYNEEWTLHFEGAAFLEQRNILLISDLHIGKLSHFRKAGIGLPSIGETINFERINKLLSIYCPAKVLFIGDLFHNKESKIWSNFGTFLNENKNIDFVLIKGNHDTFLLDQFNDYSNFSICDEMKVGKYMLTHEPLEQNSIPEGLVNICGHIHPAVKLKGKGRQSLVIRCFVFKPKQLIMPAFGEFTGNFVIQAQQNDLIFGIGKNEIFRIN